jgi:hypothetical protein
LEKAVSNDDVKIVQKKVGAKYTPRK